MPTPYVSVLTTAYNREAYIGQAIESVLQSTFTDFELIIVDDLSNDGTVEIAKCYTYDPRVRLYVNEKNLGDYPNRNKAAGMARGKYIKYLDSDDIIYPHSLEIMVKCMDMFPAAALGVCRPPLLSTPYPIQIVPEKAYQEHFLCGGLFTMGPSGCIIKTSAFNTVNRFSGKRFVGDTEAWLKLSAKYPVVIMQNDLVWWRRHSDQEYVKGHEMLEYYLSDYPIAVQALMDSACPLSQAEIRQALHGLKIRQSRIVWRLAVREYNLQSAFAIYSKSHLSASDLLLPFINSD